jgi:hypothetical protein
MTAVVTGFTREAERMLRDPHQVKWYVVALLAFVFYVYAVEVERRRWDIVLAGLAFWLMDWFNEVVNALVLHFSHRAALWTVTGSTAYLILIGLTIEISFLFLVSGVIFVKFLPPDRHARILGIPNRWVYVLGFSCLCVFVEVLLHAAGIFHWEYWWWNVPFVPLIVIFGYATFFAVAAWVFDMGTDHKRQLRVVGGLAALDVTLIVVFGPILGWI